MIDSIIRSPGGRGTLVRVVVPIALTLALVGLPSAALGGGADPGASISDESQREGDPGNEDCIAFTVSLDAPATRDSFVTWSTADFTAVAGSDYIANQREIFIPQGETSGDDEVCLIGDTVGEAEESFFVNLSGADHVQITDGQGVMTILDDDGGSDVPALSIEDATLIEGNVGEPEPCVLVAVTLSEPSSDGVSVAWATSPGTATADVDYATASGTIDFLPGETSKDVQVCGHTDNGVEDDEDLFVDLTNAVGADLFDPRSIVTIIDDDSPAGALRVTAENATVVEGGPDDPDPCFPFTVTLTQPAAQEVSVDYATEDGTADSPSDYDAQNGTFVFAPGETEKQALLCLNPDVQVEPKQEVFYVDLTDPVGALILNERGVMTVLDDDGGPAQITSNNGEVFMGGGPDFAVVRGSGNHINTGGGNDDINVLGCDNEVVTETGNDDVAAIECGNEINAGRGNDDINGKMPASGRLWTFGESPSLVVNAGAGSDSFTGAAAVGTVVAALTKVAGQGGKDNLSGKAGPDQLGGGGGKDVLNGGGGNDLLNGGGGTDTCNGGGGRNRFQGCERGRRRP